MQTLHDHFHAVLHSVAVIPEPFPHFYLSNVLPPSFYAQLMAARPPAHLYSPLPVPYQSRLSAELNPALLSRLAEPLRRVWTEYEAWINSQSFLDAVAVKFAPWLSQPYEYRRQQLALAANGRIGVRPRTLLSRDGGTFSIGPHSDAPPKFMEAIFYMPADGTMREFGTSLYTPKQPGFTQWLSTHHKHSAFDLVKTVENLPNSAVFFIKTDRSFHGVEKKVYPDTGRDVVLWFPELAGPHEKLSLPVGPFLPG